MIVMRQYECCDHCLVEDDWIKHAGCYAWCFGHCLAFMRMVHICQGGRLELDPNCRCGWSGEDMASPSCTAIPTSSYPSPATWSPGPRRQRRTTSEAAGRFQIAQQPKMLFEAKAEILPGSRRLPILSRIVRNTKQIPFQLFIFGRDYDRCFFLLILPN